MWWLNSKERFKNNILVLHFILKGKNIHIYKWPLESREECHDRKQKENLKVHLHLYALKIL